MPKYSIITPVYNAFSMMNRYFASLEQQTYKDFEVIIVDDCSTDGSYEGIQKYAAASPLDVHLCKTRINGGPGGARNMGMDAAKGEWITFVDSDDWVETNLLERIDAVIGSNDVHCVIYDYYIQRKDNRTVARSMYRGKTGQVSLSECMISARNHTIGKFYKLTDCNAANIRFPNLRRCEDVAFVARAIDACGSAYYLHEPMYYYWQRNDSLSNDAAMDESDMITAFRILEEDLGGKYPRELAEKSVPDLLYGVLLTMCKAGKSSEEICDYITAYEKKYPNWEQCEMIDQIGTAKKAFLMCAEYRAVLPMKLIAKMHTRIVVGGGK